MVRRNGASETARASAQEMMKLVYQGKIKQHLMGEHSLTKHGALEELECQTYSEFVRTRMCYDIMQLDGSGTDGSY